jgi:hypothetical protein
MPKIKKQRTAAEVKVAAFALLAHREKLAYISKHDLEEAEHKKAEWLRIHALVEEAWKILEAINEMPMMQSQLLNMVETAEIQAKLWDTSDIPGRLPGANRPTESNRPFRFR